MNPVRLADLPEPPPGKTGWPWTTESKPLSAMAPRGKPWPHISVVTPSYNHGPFLEETIRSVLLQGYPNLEYIVIDGGSTDNSVKIIRKYEKFLAYWVSEKDRGQADAINKGFLKTAGESQDLMGWLNSDDMLLPNALHRIAREFANRPNINILCGLRKIIDQESRLVGNAITELPIDFILRYLSVVPQETTYWRRIVFEKVGLLNTELQFALDYEYWQRVLDAGYHFTLIPSFLGAFRSHAAGKSAYLLEAYYREMPLIFERFLGRRIDNRQAKHEIRGARHPRLPIFRKYQYEKLRHAPLLLLRLYLLRIALRIQGAARKFMNKLQAIPGRTDH